MILDLFAGPGGWSEGLRLLGRSDVGIEWDRDACATRAAAGHRSIRADVSLYPTSPFDGLVEGLIASPPCQDFSNAGLRAGRTGEKGQLIDDVPRWIDDLRPEWLACEQVPPALHVWEEFAGLFASWGYSTWTGILNAADYGVAQTRRRAILLASRVKTVGEPPPTHEKNPEPRLFGDTPRPWVTMAEALGWDLDAVLGFPRRADSDDVVTIDGIDYRARDLFPADGPAQVLTEKARSWKRYKPRLLVNTGRDWKPGGTREDAQEVDASSSPAPPIDGKGRWHARLEGSDWPFRAPATTIAGDPRISARCHHDENVRSLGNPTTTDEVLAGSYDGKSAIKLTEPEASILQSFDPAYPWQGTRTKKFEQIGNAVPPLLAAAILKEVLG